LGSQLSPCTPNWIPVFIFVERFKPSLSYFPKFGSGGTRHRGTHNDGGTLAIWAPHHRRGRWRVRLERRRHSRSWLPRPSRIIYARAHFNPTLGNYSLQTTPTPVRDTLRPLSKTFPLTLTIGGWRNMKNHAIEIHDLRTERVKDINIARSGCTHGNTN